MRASGSIWFAGSFAGMPSRAARASCSLRRAVLIARSAGGIAAFLAATVVSGSASSAARARSAAASSFSARRTRVFAALRAGLAVILVFASIAAA